MFYSKTTGGFYDRAIHGDSIPADAVEITSESHNALMAGQSSGKRIVADENGFPVLADRLPATPPTSVTMRQARRALLDAGLLDDVDAALAAITDEKQRRTAQIDWEFAQTVDRGSEWVTALSTALGLTDATLDALFSSAATT